MNWSVWPSPFVPTSPLSVWEATRRSQPRHGEPTDCRTRTFSTIPTPCLANRNRDRHTSIALGVHLPVYQRNDGKFHGASSISSNRRSSSTSMEQQVIGRGYGKSMRIVHASMSELSRIEDEALAVAARRRAPPEQRLPRPAAIQ